MGMLQNAIEKVQLAPGSGGSGSGTVTNDINVNGRTNLSTRNGNVKGTSLIVNGGSSTVNNVITCRTNISLNLFAGSSISTMSETRIKELVEEEFKRLHQED